MVNILFISNDKRISGLISYLQPLLKTAINSTADFDQGLKDVFDKRPDLVFIQRKIGGVSGDAVAQHIKELLRGKRPKIILLQDDSENIPMNSCYDDSVGFILQEPELYRVFQKYLEKYPELPWREQHVAAETETGSVDSGAPAPAPAAAATQTVTKKPDPVKHKPQPAKTAAAKPAIAEPDELDAVFGDIPFEYTPVKRRRWKVVAPVAAALIVGISIWGAFSWFSGHNAKLSSRNARSSAAAGRPAGSLHLPAIVVVNKADSAFAAENPGWQKFPGEKVDFRIFREKGKMKVIQAIVHGEAVGDEFLNAFLLDLFGRNDCTIASEAVQEGYLVQKGSASLGSEIIIYRQDKTKLIKGFVISFS